MLTTCIVSSPLIILLPLSLILRCNHFLKCPRRRTKICQNKPPPLGLFFEISWMKIERTPTFKNTPLDKFVTIAKDSDVIESLFKPIRLPLLGKQGKIDFCCFFWLVEYFHFVAFTEKMLHRCVAPIFREEEEAHHHRIG